MQFEEVMTRLKAVRPPEGWQSNVLLLPEAAMRTIWQRIVEQELRCCLELGTGWGATSCVIAAALDEIGGGELRTIDVHQLEPINVRFLMQATGVAALSAVRVDAVADPLGYNWVLADEIEARSATGRCAPRYDFCLLDGAHEWSPDALAFYLAAKLLKPGGWLAVDDLDFRLRDMPHLAATPYACYSDRELDSLQMLRVFDLAVRQHPDFYLFSVQDGRVGWSRKRPAGLRGLLSRLRHALLRVAGRSA